MNLYDTGLWMSDIRKAAEQVPELTALAGKSVLITGAYGLIASACTDILIAYNLSSEEKIQIYAAGRSPEKMRARFEPFWGREWFHFLQYDALKEISEIPENCSYMIHAAGNAFPAMIVKEPVETMQANFDGMRRLLDLAKETGAGRLLYVSSSEIYGRKEGNEPYGENDLGYIDILNPRNSYSIAKRAAETLCVSYAAEYGVSSVIVRPGHIYGPTASPTDNRVSSAFAYAAARGEDLVLKSSGSQLRSYCYAPDAASAILKVLIKGESGRAYNIGNPESIISIREMAECLAESGGVRLTREEASEAEKKGFNPMSNSSLDCTSLVGLGWKGAFDAATGLGNTVRILKKLYNEQ